MRTLNSLVCEDIRQEVSNKVTLIGVSPASDITLAVQPPPGPFGLMLSFYAQAKLDPGDESPDQGDFVVRLGGVEVGRQIMPLEMLNRNQPINLVLNLKPAILPGLGELTFDVRLTRGGNLVGEVHHAVNILAAAPTQAPPTV